MSFQLRDVDHGYKSLLQRLRRARNRIGAASAASPSHRISIGIHEGEAMAIAYDGSAEDITLAEVAAEQEYGNPDINLPERSFIRSWFDENRQRLARELKFAELAELQGNPDALKQLAQRWASEVRHRIVSRAAGLQALAPATVAARERAGIGQTVPLDATGQLVNSIRGMVDGEYV